ncbi:DUF4329 domain-containing protein [Aliiroseovarius sp. KMU-50]|uniref:DUF4329 domain-containing protein n=1 Tax=Aliiroseovarius salicola TaxID=3009082 RepID=A0ABT4W405_9RHOB|nr:DUF4329 domain-containing protein [Aliiroseovarius sp. KMU-50]MDA5095262.1 DUF4329 domain-containing protein [Aliiroseovarius sp. KMU-50]
MRRYGILGTLCLALPFGANATVAQGAEELALVKLIFAQLQVISIEKNREYCGYIGRDAEGKVAFSKARRGRKGTCAPDDPDELSLVTASYHTHGAYSPNYVNELPSVEDMEGDEAEGIDGWVATPGGRLWYVDTEEMVVHQICGLGCLPSDPQFIEGDTGLIEQSYYYDELVQKIEEAGG